MLPTILVMALAVSLEPFRIGMTVLMLNRPKPFRQLLAFLCGGFAMGVSVGLVVLFGLRRTLTGSTYFTLPRVQVVIGALALVGAVILAMKPVGLRDNKSDGLPARARALAQRLLNGRSLWVAGVAGLGIALPSIDYLAALAVILASGAAAVTQVSALLMFNAVAFALVEIPLFAYAVAPGRTRSRMTALHEWIRARRRLEVAGLLAVVGAVLLAVGIAGL